MTETFNASNGLELGFGDQGHIMIPAVEMGLGEQTREALRELFQAERDQELGWWRWPERPDCMAKGVDGSRDRVVILEESTGLAREFWRNTVERPSATDYHSRLKPAARAYFAAHPEPKPWHDAKPGEVWALTDRLLGWERLFVRADRGFRSISRKNVFLDESRIAAGRRIWPEVSDDV